VRFIAYNKNPDNNTLEDTSLFSSLMA
jgi:hypothetical protein